MIRSTTLPHKVWKFVTHQDVTYHTSIKDRTFTNEWLDIQIDGTIIVKGSNSRGYAWDGCTPKWEILDLVIGTPDGRLDYTTEQPITYYASLLHDVLYQFKSQVPITRKETDQLFREQLKIPRFFWTPIYYLAVRTFGGFLGTWKTK